MEIQTIASFLSYYERLRERTQRLIEVVPPESLDWSYRPGKYAIGDVIRHIAAMERYMFVENAFGRPSAYRGCGKDIADGYAEVRAWFDAMHAESIGLLSELTDADLQRKCMTPGGAAIAVWKWLRAMAEHEIHHRGELYIYLNLLGVKTPPMFGLTAEEVQERSLG